MIFKTGQGLVDFPYVVDGESSSAPTPTPTPTLNPNATPTPIATVAPISVTKVSLNKTYATLKVSQSLQLYYSVTPYNATKRDVVWTSSNTKVATVSVSGKVVTKNKGTAAIVISSVDGGKIATCLITVTQPVKSVKLNKTTLSILKGKTSKLFPTINPTNASNKKVTWKSSSKAIAIVSSSGTVKGIKKGTCYITVTTVDGKKSAKCKVVVK